MFERIRKLFKRKDFLTIGSPCWVINAKDKRGFFAEVLKTIPDGAILDIEDYINKEYEQTFEPFKSNAERRVKSGFWPKPVMITLSDQSRKLIEKELPEVFEDGGCMWGEIRIYNSYKMFFESFDFMYEDDIVLPEDFPESKLIEWKEIGIIRNYQLEE